jgi:hypothetical protein
MGLPSGTPGGRAPRGESLARIDPGKREWLANAMSISRGLAPSLLATAAGFLSAGCSKDDCASGPCPKPSLTSSRDDFTVQIERAGLVTVGTGATDSSIDIRGGEVVFSTGNSSCVGTPASPCVYTLKKVDLELGPFALSLSGSERASVSDLRLFLEGPLEMEDRGTGAILPPGTRFNACMQVDGAGQHSTSPLSSPMFMTIVPTEQLFTFDGTVDFEVHLSAADCAARKLAAKLMLSGSKPWAAVPDGG